MKSDSKSPICSLTILLAIFVSSFDRNPKKRSFSLESTLLIASYLHRMKEEERREGEREKYRERGGYTYLEEEEAWSNFV